MTVLYTKYGIKIPPGSVWKLAHNFRYGSQNLKISLDLTKSLSTGSSLVEIFCSGVHHPSREIGSVLLLVLYVLWLYNIIQCNSTDRPPLERKIDSRSHKICILTPKWGWKMHIESSFVFQKPFFRRVAWGIGNLFICLPFTIDSDSESQSAMVQITFE